MARLERDHHLRPDDVAVGFKRSRPDMDETEAVQSPKASTFLDLVSSMRSLGKQTSEGLFLQDCTRETAGAR
jgi:hypothetical protein